MNVSYKNGELRDTCLELHKADKKLGRLTAGDLINMITEIEAVTNAGEISNNMNHRNVHTNKCIKICIGKASTAVFVAVGTKFKKRGGHPIWSTVTRVRLDKII